MATIDAYIYIIIGLLGVAYPILLQVISRLDEKYSSENILVLFDQELESKGFKYALYFSLTTVVVWSLKLQPMVNVKYFNFLIINSAELLISLSGIVLVIVFFLFVNKILIYYTPTKFIIYLQKKHEIDHNDYKYFIALSDCLLLSIKHQQINISLTLSQFFYIAFKEVRDKAINIPVIYPDAFYTLIYRSIEELSGLKDRRNYLLENRTAGGIWLLGELQGAEISEKTYSCIWENINLIIKYQNDNLIVNHWQTAHQYFIYNLLDVSYDNNSIQNNFQTRTVDQISKRVEERRKFIEFHYYIGGILTYKERFHCIKRLFNYTQSQPPRYELLPETMQEIFDLYFDINDPYENEYTNKLYRYPFPEISGIYANIVFKRMVSLYIVILFLRQYTISNSLISIHPLDYPIIPTLQNKIKDWIDGLPIFKSLLLEHLSNEKLLGDLKLEFLTHEWCRNINKPYPLNFIDSLECLLKEKYNSNANDFVPCEEKISNFMNSSKLNIETEIKKLLLVNNEVINLDTHTDNWYVNGQHMLYIKDAFLENPEADYFNYDSFLASKISRSLSSGLVETFFRKATKTYLLKSDDIFKAIDKLCANDEFIILNVGIDLEYFNINQKITGLNQCKYKNISIFYFNSTHIVNPSLFIIKKSDLPTISFCNISKDIIDKYSLNQISKLYNLYGSIINLNDTTTEIWNEFSQISPACELKKSVLLSLVLSIEFKWKKQIELVHLNQYSQYSQRGIANTLADLM